MRNIKPLIICNFSCVRLYLYFGGLLVIILCTKLNEISFHCLSHITPVNYKQQHKASIMDTKMIIAGYEIKINKYYMGISLGFFVYGCFFFFVELAYRWEMSWQ